MVTNDIVIFGETHMNSKHAKDEYQYILEHDNIDYFLLEGLQTDEVLDADQELFQFEINRLYGRMMNARDIWNTPLERMISEQELKDAADVAMNAYSYVGSDAKINACKNIQESPKTYLKKTLKDFNGFFEIGLYALIKKNRRFGDIEKGLLLLNGAYDFFGNFTEKWMEHQYYDFMLKHELFARKIPVIGMDSLEDYYLQSYLVSQDSYRAELDEYREKKMAETIYKYSQNGNVFAIMGKDHVKGVVEHLKNEYGVSELTLLVPEDEPFDKKEVLMYKTLFIDENYQDLGLLLFENANETFEYLTKFKLADRQD